MLLKTAGQACRIDRRASLIHPFDPSVAQNRRSTHTELVSLLPPVIAPTKLPFGREMPLKAINGNLSSHRRDVVLQHGKVVRLIKSQNGIPFVPLYCFLHYNIINMLISLAVLLIRLIFALNCCDASSK